MRYNVLRRNNEFVRAYTRGKAHVHSQLVVYVNKNRLGFTRIGITASKKVGGAVVRNRAKRVLRAAIAEVLPLNVGAYDIVFVARGQTAKCKSWQVAESIKKLLVGAGVLNNNA